MLMACKAEFHRRLRVYNEWKMKTSNQVMKLIDWIRIYNECNRMVHLLFLLVDLFLLLIAHSRIMNIDISR